MCSNLVEKFIKLCLLSESALTVAPELYQTITSIVRCNLYSYLFLEMAYGKKAKSPFRPNVFKILLATVPGPPTAGTLSFGN